MAILDMEALLTDLLKRVVRLERRRGRRGGAAVAPDPNAGALTGEIKMWAGSGTVAPTGWIFCRGQALSKTFYPELYAVVGSIYAPESGGNFYAPNLAAKMPIGAGGTYALGSTGGEATHTLTVNEMPSHTHAYSTNSATAQFTTGGGTGMDIRQTNNATSSPTGGGAAHNNLPPYLAINFIIKT
jgi:microcystin-dependent protein